MPIEMPKPKPCPKCGCERTQIEYKNYEWTVRCIECLHKTPVERSERAAIDTWNGGAENGTE